MKKALKQRDRIGRLVTIWATSESHLALLFRPKWVIFKALLRPNFREIATSITTLVTSFEHGIQPIKVFPSNG